MVGVEHLGLSGDGDPPLTVVLLLDLTYRIQQGAHFVPGQVVRHWMGINLLKGRVLLVVEVVATYFVVIGFGHIGCLLPCEDRNDDEAQPPTRTDEPSVTSSPASTRCRRLDR